MERENIEIVNDTVVFKPIKNTYSNITKSIKFKPSKELKIYLNKCFGTHRYFYNKGVNMINDSYKSQLEKYKKRNKLDKCCALIKNKLCTRKNIPETFFCKKHSLRKLKFIYHDIKDLRNNLIPKVNELTEDKIWQKEIPYDIKQNSLRLLLSNYKSAISNKKNNGNSFTINHIKKSPNQICKLPSSFINFRNMEMMVNYGKNHKFKMKKKFIKWLESVNYMVNDTITINKQGKHYYIHLAYETKNLTIEKPFNCVSIDPGVRKFATLYSPEGIEGYMGKDITKNKNIKKICSKIDKYRSIIARKGNTDNQGNLVRVNNRTIYKLKKKVLNYTRKIKGYIKNFHNHLINFLCLNFNTIIIGKFDPSKKVKKINRQITAKTVRDMLILSHTKFVDKLKAYAERVKTNIIISSEEYTSKTCGLCGHIDGNLGSTEIYKCKNIINNKKCSFKMDRDLNGARNIFIKTITQMINLI